MITTQTNIKTERQTLNCRMETLLIKAPPEKKYLSNEKKKYENRKKSHACMDGCHILHCSAVHGVTH